MLSNIPSARFAHLKVAAGAVLISFSPVWVRLSGVAPTVSAFYRVFLGGVVLWMLAAVGRRRSWAGKGTLAIAGVLGFVLAFDLTVWHQSIGFIGPGMATILGNFQVFILTGFGIVFLRERLTPRFVTAVVFAMAGLVLMFGLDWSQLSTDYRIGVGFGLLTAVLYSCFLIGLRTLQARPGAMHPTATMAWMSVMTSVVLALGIGATGDTFAIPDTGSAISLAAYALGSHAIGWLLIADGLPKVAASRAGLLLLLQPSLAFVWDMVLFGRATTGVELVGAVMALGAIYLGAVKDGEGR